MRKQSIWNYWAPRYERLWAQHFSLGPARKLITEYIQKEGLQPSNILDIGCGVGQLVSDLSTAWPETRITGADTSLAMIETARKNHSGLNIRYLNVPIEEVSDQEKFDIIVSTHSLPYFPDKQRALQNMYQLLNPGGRVLIIHTNADGWYDRFWHFFVKLTTSKAEFFPTHELKTMIENAGFMSGTICSIDKYFFIPTINMVEGIKDN